MRRKVDLAKLQELLREDKTPSQMAKELGVSVKTVRKYLRRLRGREDNWSQVKDLMEIVERLQVVVEQLETRVSKLEAAMKPLHVPSAGIVERLERAKLNLSDLKELARAVFDIKEALGWLKEEKKRFPDGEFTTKYYLAPLGFIGYAIREDGSEGIVKVAKYKIRDKWWETTVKGLAFVEDTEVAMNLDRCRRAFRKAAESLLKNLSWAVKKVTNEGKLKKIDEAVKVIKEVG